MWFALLLLLAAVGVGTTAAHLQAFDNPVLERPPLYNLPPKVIDLVTLGHRGAYDDFVFLWLLQQIFSDPQHPLPSAEEVERKIGMVLPLEIPIEGLYLASCFVLGLTYHRPEGCLEIATHGLKALPLSWTIPMTQGYMYAFAQDQPAQGAFFYLYAARQPKAPKYLKSLAEKLVRKTQSDADRTASLELLSSFPSNPEFRSLIQQHIGQATHGDQQP